MKKNLIAITVAAAVIAPLTAQAVDDDFDVDISGDARLRYYTNLKKSPGIDNQGNPYIRIQKGAQTDSRLGLNVQGTYGKEVMLKARLEFENIHDTQYDTSSSPEEDPSSDKLVSVDHAYISVNVGAGVNVTGGSTIENWGHKLYMWDDVGDRVSITKKFSDIELGLHYSKQAENGLPLGPSSDSTDSQDDSGTHLTLKWGEMGGIRHDRFANDGDSGGWAAFTDIYATIPVADWTVAFEYLYAKDSQQAQEYEVGDFNKTALLVAGIGKVASTDLMVGYASVAGGLSTDDDCLPFVGTGKNPGSMLTYLATESDTSKSLMFVIADVPVGTVNLQGSIASLSQEGGGDPDDIILGFKVSQAISKNTTVTGGYASFSGESFDGRMMGAHIEIEF